MTAPYVFDEFFASGRDESISPFLTPRSRGWGKNLPLKSALLSAALLVVAFVFSFMHPGASSLCLVGVYFLAGTPALIGSLEDLKNLEVNIDVLMTLAALLSVVIGSEMEGALLLVLFALSASMEQAVAQKTKGAISHLQELSPRFAFVVDENGTLFERSVREIAVGTKLLIKAGEIVPLDGVVIAGSSFVNLVHLTGESAPISKKPSDEVQAGARNLDGTLTIQVTRTSADSTLSRIIQLITQAQEARPKLQRFLDRFGKWYASVVIALTALFAVTLPYLFSIPYLGTEGGIYRALAFLIAASPCALIIATPTAYLSALSSCARRGILLKGGVILDALASATQIAFDKTGTLTTGKLSCKGMEPLTPSSISAEEALAIAAALERHAVHPIAEAITRYAAERNIAPLQIQDFKATPGSGLEGVVHLHGKTLKVAIGHGSFVLSKVARPPAVAAGKTLLLVGESLFAFQFTDQLRAEVPSLLTRLMAQKQFRLFLLTGDHAENTQEIAARLPLNGTFTDLRPQDKLEKVTELSQRGGLIMVGDGINDAPALARATVGISLGKIGSATAVDASDVVFLQDDLSQLDWLIDKAHQTMRIVRQNLALALSVIIFATTPALLGLIPLWLAVVLHEGGTLLVGLSSLRLLRYRL